jgi:predicted MPP superfamily phosphohydrolase
MILLTLMLGLTELLALAGPLQVVGHVLYRVAYFLTFPVQLLIIGFKLGAPPEGPLLRAIAAGVGSPLLYAGVWRLFARVTRRNAKRDVSQASGLDHAREERLSRASGLDHAREERLSRAKTLTCATSIERVANIEKDSEIADRSRRGFFGVAACSVGVAAVGATGYGALAEPFRIVTRRYTIPIADLPAELSGLRLVQLSDTHYGPFVPLSHIERAIEQANALVPDFVLLTGDYVHSTKASIADGVGIFAKLRPRVGTVAVLGNHDHWEDAAAIRRIFARLKIPTIDNQRVFCSRSKTFQRSLDSSSGLCVAGVGDYWNDRVDLAHALEHVPPEMPRLVLSHNPDVASSRLVDSQRVDLMFSGHTHGGQVVLPGIGPLVSGSRYGNRYAGGLCQGPRFPVVVSRGIGVSIVPVRIGAPPEIVQVTLVRAARSKTTPG